MRAIGSANSEIRRSSDTSLNTTSLAGNNPISSQISTVNSVGAQNCFPGRSITNDQVAITGDRNELHQANHSKQAEVIHQMLSETFPTISKEMVLSVLCAGASGNLAQQEINYRPENNLILLTLLKPEELKTEKGLIESAASLIKKLHVMGEKNSQAKQVLGHEEKAFDKKIESAISTLGQDKLQILAQRYQQQYVDPAIKEKLGEYFNQEDIDSRPINDFLVSSLNHGCEQRAAGAINEYQQHKSQAFVDKACQIHNLFLALEEKIETIRPLKVIMDLGQSSAQTQSPIEELPLRANRAGDDEIDAGRPHLGASPSTPLTPSTPLLPSSTSHKENMHNTYITNNYYASPHATASINSVPSNDEENKKPLLSTSFKSVVNMESNSPVVQTSGRVRTTFEIPSIKQYQPQVAEKTFLESKPLVAEETVKKEAKPVIEQETSEQIEQPRKHVADIQWLLPKNTGFQNRYIQTESGWKSSNASESEVKPVVTTAGGLNRSQADKEIYQGLRAAPQTVPAEQMFADSIAKADELFTGTERGALRANQAEVERYNDNAKRFP
ncbi:hypothetical protein [Providencia alcalifaciens]|uniref:hypothetical protein n=1 Tax=Providencia alcalifaciens TaxID=126385 RepID=UPI002B05E77E|nr:hypothetical protein [Providencia alcalifaciens]